MMKKHKSTVIPEQHKQMLLDSNLKEIVEKFDMGILPKNPTRRFAVDERIQFGAHQETYIREICEDGLYYKVESIGVKRERDKPATNETRYVEWIEIFPYNKAISVVFSKEEKYRIKQLNTSIESLLHMVYHPGVDFDVEYQREHVWELTDKVALIDSIFNNIDIGKFVFVQRSFNTRGKLYEIIDGKQRLTALREFYEDRFQYKGYFFSELNPVDKNNFENHSIVYGYLENPDKRAIFETFIKLNTTGRPMENKDIEKVKKLLNELND